MNAGRVMMANDDERKKGNLRLALILASVALVFFLGFVANMLLTRH